MTKRQKRRNRKAALAARIGRILAAPFVAVGRAAAGFVVALYGLLRPARLLGFAVVTTALIAAAHYRCVPGVLAAGTLYLAAIIELIYHAFAPKADFDEHRRFTIIPQVGQEYALLECDRPATVWVIVNTAAMAGGDRLYLRRYLGLGGEEPLLHSETAPIDGPRSEPVETVSAFFAPSCRVALLQSHGLSKRYEVETFIRYERVPRRG